MVGSWWRLGGLLGIGATELDVLYVAGKAPEKRHVVHRHDGRRRSSRRDRAGG